MSPSSAPPPGLLHLILTITVTSGDLPQADPSPSSLLPVTLIPPKPNRHPPLSVPRCVVSPRLQSGCQLPPPGVGVRSWGMHSTSPWRTMRRACGARTLSRASRRLWPSTRRVAAGRSSCLMRARCTVRTHFFFLSSRRHAPFFFFLVTGRVV